MASRLPDSSRDSANKKPPATGAATPEAGAAKRWHLWIATIRRRGGGLWTLVAGLATVIGLVTGVLSLLDNPRIRSVPTSQPSPMLGDLRLAVAPFDSTDSREGRATPASATAAMRVAAGVADRLTTELAPLRGRLRVELRPPSQLHPIDGTSPARRAAAAASLARQHGADLLVHGTLVVDTASTRLEPHVYLAGGVRSDADELLGDHKLGAAVVTPGDPESNLLLARELSEHLATRVRALALLSVGITYYHLDRLAEADRYLTLAGQTAGWRDSEGTELLHLFIGNVASRRGAELRRDDKEPLARAQFARAIRAYRAALSVEPGYARALYGIAETRFLQLDLRCKPGTHDQTRQLQQVVATFATAGRAPHQPAGANLDLKIDFGIGRAYVCLSLAGDNYRAPATAHLSQVLAAVDSATRPQTPALTRLAAETHGQLGLLALAEPDGADRRTRLQAAVGHYQRAITLSQAYPDRARAYWKNLASIYDQLGDQVKANQALKQA
jgi:tetratricopeptide (TPR) repeat protein